LFSENTRKICSIRLHTCAPTALNGYISIYYYYISLLLICTLLSLTFFMIFIWSYSFWITPFSKHKGISAKISVCTPRFCTVYAVAKGKLSIRPSDTEVDGSIIDNTSETSFSSSSSSNYTSTSQTGKYMASFAILLLKR